MKKIINNPDNVVNEMLEGLTAAYGSDLARLEGFDVVVRKSAKKTDQVALVSGGGSGHEPAHAGYVGSGMLDAAVCGAMFTSPTPDQIYEAIKAVDCGKGVLLVIKNYTGDVMNFEMAAELAQMDDIQTEQVIVSDDVAVENSLYTAGRRGIAGTVFVHKIAGALAESGASLAEVKAIAQKVCDNVRSMGMAISPCTVPAVGKPSFELSDSEMEIGIGIHGEPGIRRETIRTADEITEELFQKILAEGIFNSWDRVAVLVNGMGGTPISELYIVNRKLQMLLKKNDLIPAKTLVGNYMTSLDMQGFSITLLKLDDTLERLLNAPAKTAAYVCSGR